MKPYDTKPELAIALQGFKNEASTLYKQRVQLVLDLFDTIIEQGSDPFVANCDEEGTQLVFSFRFHMTPKPTIEHKARPTKTETEKDPQ